MENITINGREFQVTRIELDAALTAKGRKVYGLTGAKGAQYAAMQYINRPELYHVMQASFSGSAPFPGVVLTDASGKLEVR